MWNAKWSILTFPAHHGQWYSHEAVTMNLIRGNWLWRTKDVEADPFALFFIQHALLWAYLQLFSSMFWQFHFRLNWLYFVQSLSKMACTYIGNWSQSTVSHAFDCDCTDRCLTKALSFERHKIGLNRRTFIMRALLWWFSSFNFLLRDKQIWLMSLERQNLGVKRMRMSVDTIFAPL